ncbi:MAG: hypothetical protein RBJ76_24900 [Stenomitos frigidus ULC029]
MGLSSPELIVEQALSIAIALSTRSLYTFLKSDRPSHRSTIDRIVSVQLLALHDRPLRLKWCVLIKTCALRGRGVWRNVLYKSGDLTTQTR